jgi:uncharacterized protein YjbJ (UPF0337 family)
MGKDLEQRGLENQVKGTAKEMEGQVRGDLGDATDNTSEHIMGRAEEREEALELLRTDLCEGEANGLDERHGSDE